MDEQPPPLSKIKVDVIEVREEFPDAQSGRKANEVSAAAEQATEDTVESTEQVDRQDASGYTRTVVGAANTEATPSLSQEKVSPLNESHEEASPDRPLVATKNRGALLFFLVCAAVAMTFAATNYVIKKNQAVRFVKVQDGAVPITMKSALPGNFAEEISLPRYPRVDTHSAYPGFESNAHKLETVYRDIGLGIAELKHSGDRAKADALRTEFETLKRRFETGKGFTKQLTPPLHVLSTLFPKNPDQEKAIVVTYDAQPVTLLLHTNVPSKLKIQLKGNAKVAHVYILQPTVGRTTVRGLPADVPVTELKHPGWINANIVSPSDIHHLHDITGTLSEEICTIQSNLPHSDWFIGKESVDWRAQMALREAQPLHARAMEPVRQKLLNWFATNPVSVTVRNQKEFVEGILIPPRTVADHVPGIKSQRWNDGAPFELAVRGGVSKGHHD